MKTFRFSLEAVQTVRDRATRDALEEYARALKVRAAAEAELAKAEEALRKHMHEWRGRMGKAFSPYEMLQCEHQRAMLEARRNETVRALRDAAHAANKAQADFQLARQKSDVVERFHDRQRREFNLAQLKQEQHFLDDLSSARRDLAQKGYSHA